MNPPYDKKRLILAMIESLTIIGTYRSICFRDHIAAPPWKFASVSAHASQSLGRHQGCAVAHILRKIGIAAPRRYQVCDRNLMISLSTSKNHRARCASHPVYVLAFLPTAPLLPPRRTLSTLERWPLPFAANFASRAWRHFAPRTWCCTHIWPVVTLGAGSARRSLLGRNVLSAPSRTKYWPDASSRFGPYWPSWLHYGSSGKTSRFYSHWREVGIYYKVLAFAALWSHYPRVPQTNQGQKAIFFFNTFIIILLLQDI